MTQRQRWAGLRRSPRRLDEGFGLIEIVVSMFLLALLMIAFLPFLANAMIVTVRNSTTATASQLASEELDALGLVETCATYEQRRVTIVNFQDERGTTYSVARTMPACPTSGFPKSLPVQVEVAASPADVPGGGERITIAFSTTVVIERLS